MTDSTSYLAADAPHGGQPPADSSAPSATYPSMRATGAPGAAAERRSHDCPCGRSGCAVNSTAGVATTQFAGWHRVADGGIGKR